MRISAEIKDPHRVLHECLKKIGDLSRSPRVNLITGDINKNTGFVLACSDDAKMSDHAVDLEKYPEVREVLLKGSIIYIKDITANPLTKDIKDNVKTIDISSLLVFPIRHRGETLATMSIRIGEEGLSVSDKHLKTFYMAALAMGPKVAAKKLIAKYNASQGKAG